MSAAMVLSLALSAPSGLVLLAELLSSSSGFRGVNWVSARDLVISMIC